MVMMAVGMIFGCLKGRDSKVPGKIQKPMRQILVRGGVSKVWVWAIYLASSSFGKNAHRLGGHGHPNVASSW